MSPVFSSHCVWLSPGWLPKSFRNRIGNSRKRRSSLTECWSLLAIKGSMDANFNSKFHFPGVNITTPTDCMVGHYCGAYTSIPDPCPTGTYSNALNNVLDTDCTPYFAGQYCGTTGLSASTGNCSAGYYCTGGAGMATPVNHNVIHLFTSNTFWCIYSRQPCLTFV